MRQMWLVTYHSITQVLLPVSKHSHWALYQTDTWDKSKGLKEHHSIWRARLNILQSCQTTFWNKKNTEQTFFFTWETNGHFPVIRFRLDIYVWMYCTHITDKQYALDSTQYLSTASRTQAFAKFRAAEVFTSSRKTTTRLNVVASLGERKEGPLGSRHLLRFSHSVTP